MPKDDMILCILSNVYRLKCLKFETTYLLTRAKSRDASASKNEGVAQCANTKKGVETSRDRAGTIFIACLSACLAQRSPWGEVPDWVRWVGWGG